MSVVKTGTRGAGVYVKIESKGRCQGYNDCIGEGKPRKRERMVTRGRRDHTPDMNSLEVGPGDDLVASGIRCVKLDRNTQTTNSHRSFGAEALDRLQEAPSGNGAQLDFILIHHARSADDAPSVVKTLSNRQPLPQ